jgi:hypothetical protein
MPVNETASGRVGRRLAAALAMLVVLAVVAGIVYALRPVKDEPPAPPPIPGINPLAAGQLLPALEAEGWVNGPPPTLGGSGPRVLVVDVFALW